MLAAALMVGSALTAGASPAPTCTQNTLAEAPHQWPVASARVTWLGVENRDGVTVIRKARAQVRLRSLEDLDALRSPGIRITRGTPLGKREDLLAAVDYECPPAPLGGPPPLAPLVVEGPEANAGEPRITMAGLGANHAFAALARLSDTSFVYREPKAVPRLRVELTRTSLADAFDGLGRHAGVTASRSAGLTLLSHGPEGGGKGARSPQRLKARRFKGPRVDIAMAGYGRTGRQTMAPLLAPIALLAPAGDQHPSVTFRFDGVPASLAVEAIAWGMNAKPRCTRQPDRYSVPLCVVMAADASPPSLRWVPNRSVSLALHETPAAGLGALVNTLFPASRVSISGTRPVGAYVIRNGLRDVLQALAVAYGLEIRQAEAVPANRLPKASPKAGATRIVGVLLEPTRAKRVAQLLDDKVDDFRLIHPDDALGVRDRFENAAVLLDTGAVVKRGEAVAPGRPFVGFYGASGSQWYDQRALNQVRIGCPRDKWTTADTLQSGRPEPCSMAEPGLDVEPVRPVARKKLPDHVLMATILEPLRRTAVIEDRETGTYYLAVEGLPFRGGSVVSVSARRVVIGFDGREIQLTMTRR